VTIENIPLRMLELSSLNARKTRSKATIESYAASILTHGILQNFRVHTQEEGKYGVVIGGTRLAALNLLLKRKKITADYPVPCEVRPFSDPSLTEVSLAENFVREAMHPADEFEAFKGLSDDGQGSETIAARFGVTPTIVKQRLKLAVVSPRLIAAYRKDEMTLDQLMAFTISDDHKQQEKIWKELPDWNRQRGDGSAIRAALTEQHVRADNKLTQFVGIEAYEQAGGAVLRDLFDEQGSGWLTDFALLNRLATERLESAAAPLRDEGWKWIEIAPDRNRQDTQQLGRMYPAHAEPKPEQQAEIDTLQAEADAIMEEHGEEPADEVAYGRLEALTDRIQALSEGEAVWTNEQKAIAGIVVSIGHGGEIAIERGIVRPEDKAALRRLTNDTGQGRGADDATPPAKEKGGLPAALIAELTSHKTVAAQLVLAANTGVALLAVTHALALRHFYPTTTSEHSSLGISAHGPSYSMAVREVVEKSPVARKLTGLIKSWQKKLPKQPEELWDWLARQKPATVQALLAIGTALTVDMVQANGSKAKPASADLAKAMKLDMAEHWEATAANYFARVPKKHLLDELGSNLRPNTRKQVEGMKRDMAATTIATELKGKRWIPDVLKAG
jgi:ParB family transcriptional regulator, chromosome partitioning protein